MACLCNLQVAQILNEIDTERLFSNLPEIYVANRQFWADHVYPMLKTARSTKAPLDPTSLQEGFLKVSSFISCQQIHSFDKQMNYLLSLHSIF